MKKIVFLMLAAGALVVCMASCHKDEENNTNTNTTPQDTSQTAVQKHNVELVYGKKPSTQWQHIELDTIHNYSNDQNVDTIFMVPEVYNQYSTFTTTQLQTIVPKLRERHNVNPDKVFGKGELQLNSQAVVNNYEIVRFFEDTLRYHVTYYSQAK